MKLSVLLTTLTVNQAIGVPKLIERTPTLVHRDLAAFESVTNGIDAQANTLDQSVNASPPNFDTTESESDKLLSTIQAGITTVQAQPPLELNDAVGLTGCRKLDDRHKHYHQ